MTVTSVVPPKEYVGNGVQTAFTGTFSLGAPAEAVVLLETGVGTGLYTVQTLNTDYTLSGSPSGGPFPGNAWTVTMSVAPASGIKLLLSRDTALAQTLSLDSNKAYDPKSLELALDKVVRVAQDVQEGALLKSPTNPTVFSAANNRLTDLGLGIQTTDAVTLGQLNSYAAGLGPEYTLPALSGEAGNLLKVNATEDGLETLTEIGTAYIADDAITNAKMAANSVANSQIFPNTIAKDRLNFTPVEEGPGQWGEISRQTVTDVASLTFAAGTITDTYSQVRLICDGVSVDTLGAALALQYILDDSTLKDGASDYKWHVIEWDIGYGDDAFEDRNDSKINMQVPGGSITNLVGVGGYALIELENPRATTYRKCQAHRSYYSRDGGIGHVRVTGWGQGKFNDPIGGLRLTAGAALLSGTFILEGKRAS